MAGGYSVTISAQDRVSATLNGINGNMAKFTGNLQKQAERINAPVDRARAALAKMGEVSGINRVATGIRNMGRSAVYTAGKLGEMIPLVGMIGGAASVAGIERMMSRWSEWGLRISNTSRQIGVGSRQLSALQGAANLAGGSADAMTSGLHTLGQALYDVQGGRNVEAGVMLRTLFGVEFQANAHTALEMLPKIADKVASVRDPFVRAQIGTTLLGGAWEGLEPLLVLGSKRMAELAVTAREYNFVTDEGVEKAKDLELAQRKVGAASEGLRNRIAERLSPILTPLLEHFARWIATSPLVTQGIELLGRGVAWLGDKLEHIDWAALGKQAEEWGGRLKTVLEMLQRFGILPDLSGVFGGGTKPPEPLPMDKPGGVTGPPAVGKPDTRTFLERLYKPGPGLLDGVFGPPAANRQAPNGVPQPGPTFGPQQTPDPASAPGRSMATPSFSHAAFYQQYDKAAEQAASSLGVGKAVIFAHWAQETAFGRSVHDFNLGNIQAGTGYQGQTVVRGDTHANGSAYQTRFRAYKTPEDFAADYASLIRRRYANAIGAGDDALRFGQALRAGGYMENPRGPQDIAAAADRVRREMPAAAGPPLAAPQAQGAPLALNTAPAGNDNGKDSTVRLHIEGTMDKGMNVRVGNSTGATVSGPLVQTPHLLGAMP